MKNTKDKEDTEEQIKDCISLAEELRHKYHDQEGAEHFHIASELLKITLKHIGTNKSLANERKNTAHEAIIHIPDHLLKIKEVTELEKRMAKIKIV